MEQNFELEEYTQIRQNLILLKENYPDVMYMYIYRFVPEGGIVIFDLDSEYSLDAYEPGSIYEPDPAVVTYMDDLCAGRDIPVLTGDTTDGYMLTYMRPVFDSNGEYCCHACVDFSMEKLRHEDRSFVMSLLILLMVIMAVITVIDIQIIRKDITGPINQMKHATDTFSYTGESDHANNINIMEKLEIKTGDEIEDIYHVFISFMKNNLKSLRNLSKAENDIKNKDAQIGQISLEAYNDTLTGVGSKTAYIKKISEINAMIAGGFTQLAVVMVDMNNLKHINDEYGHESGDLYIKGCCDLVSSTFKHSSVYRIGGDEFVVILQGADYDNRADLVEGLKNTFRESYKAQDRSPWLCYSAAVGLAELSEDDKSYDVLFKKADHVMYEDKKEFKSKNGSYR